MDKNFSRGNTAKKEDFTNEHEQSWHRVKDRLRMEFGEEIFTAWFDSMELGSISGSRVVLSVPSRFLKSWLQTHYLDRIIAHWEQEIDALTRVEITVRSAVRQNPILERQQQEQGQNKNQPAINPISIRHDNMFKETEKFGGSPLDPRYTFASFAVGSSNELAYAAAKQVINTQITTAYNPLFMHAGVGLGKTHLLQAIAWEIIRSQPERKMLYLTAENFMYRFVSALRSQEGIDFKQWVTSIDVLLIDDMQFLQGKSVQQEFCHTLNSLIDNGRQVVVAADRPPVEMQNLDERMRSRLAGGLTVELSSMDLNLRREVLSIRANATMSTNPSVSFSDLVLDQIARLVTTNGRDLDGAFNRVLANNQLTNAPITVEMVETALKDLLRGRDLKRVKIEDIQRVIAKHFKVSRNDLLSSRRNRSIVRPRQVAMYLAKVMTPRSLPEIGRRFGGRDHTTVLHAVRKVEALIAADVAASDEIEMLKQIIQE